MDELTMKTSKETMTHPQHGALAASLMVPALLYVVYIAYLTVQFELAQGPGFQPFSVVPAVVVLVGSLLTALRYVRWIVTALRRSEKQFILWNTTLIRGVVKAVLTYYGLAYLTFPMLEPAMVFLPLFLLVIAFSFIANPGLTIFDGDRRVVRTNRLFRTRTFSFDEANLVRIQTVLLGSSLDPTYQVGLITEDKCYEVAPSQPPEDVVALIVTIDAHTGVGMSSGDRNKRGQPVIA